MASGLTRKTATACCPVSLDRFMAHNTQYNREELTRKGVKDSLTITKNALKSHMGGRPLTWLKGGVEISSERTHVGLSV